VAAVAIIERDGQALIAASGLTGNPFFTRVVGGTVHVLDPSDIYAGEALADSSARPRASPVDRRCSRAVTAGSGPPASARKPWPLASARQLDRRPGPLMVANPV
jgi:hypothetical protein